MIEGGKSWREGAEDWPSCARGKGYVGERPELGLQEALSQTPIGADGASGAIQPPGARSQKTRGTPVASLLFD